jgi:polyhydroxyalkanoate synthesis regulator protein
MLKKYNNRRFYDPDKKRHVSVHEISERVLYGEPVIHHNTGEDVSAAVLLQMIKQDHLSAGQLRAIILAYRAGMTLKKE